MENRRPVTSKKNYLIMLTHHQLEEIINNMVYQAIEKYKSKPIKNDDVYLTRAETCKLLSISLPTLHSLNKKGILKGHKINTRVRYIESEVKKFIRKS